MFDNIIYYYNKEGQLKSGVENTPYLLDFFINKNKNKLFIKSNLNIFSDLKELYNANNSISDTKINIGGDHSMAISTLSNSLNNYDNLKVIWIDAHADINTFNESISKNYHGMPLSFLTGLDTNDNFNFIKNKLDFENLLYIGIRDLDPFEIKVIKDNNIKVISVEQFNNDFENSLNKIIEFIDNKPIHISFDVDSMDPEIIKCTGTRVSKGLELEQVIKLFEKLYNFDIKNLDITELNFEIGNNNDKIKTLNNIIKIFEKYFN
jgi:arginase